IGALPLSGVSLPFISYGGSSLICNLLAAGMVLSASNIEGTGAQMKYITRQQDKNLVPALLAACVGIVLLTITVSRYLFNNKKWVVQPSLVADRSGARMFSYNPRISILMNRLQAGTLYDRKGRILATSNPELIMQKGDSLLKAGLEKQNLQALTRKRLDRYYPFAAHMFFWTGDLNTGIFMGGSNGYFGEYEHQAELRGFQTPASNFMVSASHFREDRFLPESATEMTVEQRDYSALASLLLAGINSKAVDEFKKRNRDVYLAMDARLQTAIQQSISLDDSLRNKRVTVVIMEDSTGDVLSSASYPLPAVDDWEKLNLSTREQNKLPYWITNADLGFTLATQPGSTAKLVTALASFNKLGDRAAKRTFLIRSQDVIRAISEEPDETGTITLERAVVKSNNPYFIKLANEEQLQEEMANLYMQTGMFLKGVGGYYFENEIDNTQQQNRWRELWRKTEFRSLRSYNPNDIRKTRGRGVSGMAWGQGELIATPASIARVTAGIANGGSLMPNRFVLKVSDSSTRLQAPVTLTKEPYAESMQQFMIAQSASKTERLGIKVGGKTGTPERIVRGARINDGWYTFFAPKSNGVGHIVVCVRVEDCKGSSVAVMASGKHVIPKLLELGYIKSLDAKSTLKTGEDESKTGVIRPAALKSNIGRNVEGSDTTGDQ
ncbi:MAG TPA: penicillin-binding transpeptidase domain-containing protein, partial [Chitinophagaceae bacterium]|nr:penicillin-binding transpeptidase domain-containing protein [Chitinophagaceae bacterium]